MSDRRFELQKLLYTEHSPITHDECKEAASLIGSLAAQIEKLREGERPAWTKADAHAPQAAMVGFQDRRQYTDGDGNIHDWKVTKWWPKPPQDDLGRPIQVTPTLAMSYERDLVLFFGTGVIDSLEWTDSQDHLYAVKEERTLDASTGYYDVNDTGEWFIDETHSRFTGFDTSERLFSKPLVVAGNIFFTTYSPNPDECLPGDATIYGMRFDNLFDDIIFEEKKEMSSTPSAPAMLWTPTGPEVVVQRATRVEKLGLTNPIEPASHIVHWGKVL